jgi:hypothetical protein
MTEQPDGRGIAKPSVVDRPSQSLCERFERVGVEAVIGVHGPSVAPAGRNPRSIHPGKWLARATEAVWIVVLTGRGVDVAAVAD